MWHVIRSQFWPAWHRLMAVALLLAMFWTEYTSDDSSWGYLESNWFSWFKYPYISWTFAVVWFALFLMEQWDLGPFTRLRFCYLWVFLGLYLYSILRLPYAFFSDPFPSLE